MFNSQISSSRGSFSENPVAILLNDRKPFQLRGDKQSTAPGFAVQLSDSDCVYMSFNKIRQPVGAELQYHEIVELQPHQLLRGIDCEGALAVAVLRSDGDARLQTSLEGRFWRNAKASAIEVFYRVGVRFALFEPGCPFFVKKNLIF
jgi:hypothetical protein